MTPEQVTIYAAIIAAVGTLITLIVTIVGWFFTAQSQKELAKHQQALELQSQTQRIIRGEILPELWDKISKTEESVNHLTIHRVWFSLQNLQDEYVRGFLDRSNFDESEKAQIMRAEDRDRRYRQIEGDHILRPARARLAELENFVRRNRFYFTPDIRDAINRIQECFQRTINEVTSNTMFDVTNEVLSRIRAGYLEESSGIMAEIDELITRAVNS